MSPEPVEVVFLSISIVLFVIYILFLVTLLRYRNCKQFRSFFFTLTLILGIIDVLQMLHVYVFLRFPSFGWWTSLIYLRLPSPVVLYASSALWALAFNQHISVLMIAVNRYSAIVFPHAHKRRWTNQISCLAILICVGMGFFFILPRLILDRSPGYQITDDNTGSATIVWGNQNLLRLYKYSSVVIIALISIACSLLYLSILYTACRRRLRKLECINLLRKQSVSPGSPSRTMALLILWEKRELKLAFCGFTMFIFMFVYAIGIIYMDIGGSASDQEAKRSIWLATSDLFSGINPLLIIALSKSVRRRFLMTIGCYKPPIADTPVRRK